MLPGVLLVGGLGACSDDEPLPDAPATVVADPAAAIDLLDDLTRAVAAGDTAAGPWPAYVVANAEAAGVTDFSARYLSDDPSVSATLPSGQWAASVDLAWRFDGFDPGPAHAEVTMVFEGEGEDLRLASVGGGQRVQPLWLTGPVTVRATDDVLVLLAGDQPEAAERYAERARHGLHTVRAVLPAVADDQRVVVEVPQDAAAMEQSLAAAPGSYDAIAAVTTTADASDAPGSPVHVFVNDPLYGRLGAHGAQVVMTHEIVHLVTGAATEVGVPLWLVEGFADWVALRDSRLPLRTSAAQAIARVRADGLPTALPGAEDFDARSTHLGAAYEAAWLLVRVLAERGGVAPLLDLQRRLAAGDELGPALRATHDLTEAELVELWRSALSDLAG